VIFKTNFTDAYRSLRMLDVAFERTAHFAYNFATITTVMLGLGLGYNESEMAYASSDHVKVGTTHHAEFGGRIRHQDRGNVSTEVHLVDGHASASHCRVSYKLTIFISVSHNN
jgi:hypothetical protein